MSEMVVQVTARALVVMDHRLLLVSNNGDYWYTPGGRLNPDESLEQCAVREVYEETGLTVRIGSLVHVAEYIEQAQGRHKIECYFLARPVEGKLPEDWSDLDGPVEHTQLFTIEEMLNVNALPAFLKEGTWRDDSANGTYRGLE